MKIALCTPCRSGYVHYDHMLSVTDTIALSHKKGAQICHLVAAGCSILPRVRNQLVAVAVVEQHRVQRAPGLDRQGRAAEPDPGRGQPVIYI